MEMTKRIARSAGICLTAAGIAMTTLAAPAEAASVKCPAKQSCFYSKTWYKGESSSGMDNPPVCVNLNFGAHSMKNEGSRYAAVAYFKRDCTGDYISIPAGVNHNHFLHTIRSYH
ncbi:peptidase inhibitor family I36 protein [Streptomyces platensis]|uniref:peptidase inhibitor family I36 protein n=1 Tax=Streptomyces platensis TaxID=58346 RepID=UPI002E152EBF|nr:peptidase inhibitor family I36 protein [Streptomyces platensis]WTI53489.1 peptidase inhibitor family I36 protein [Streptomyces platensis]WUB80885.1 peptidase inhibitor family I36 protein [Streptomyces platensis]